MAHNTFFYSLNPVHYLMVPKPQHGKPLRPKPFRPAMIIILIGRMVSAIRFDDQPLLTTDNSNTVCSDGGLSSKRNAQQLSLPYRSSKTLFRIKLFLSFPSGYIHFSLAPILTFPGKGGRNFLVKPSPTRGVIFRSTLESQTHTHCVKCVHGSSLDGRGLG